jgi:hypothetical protein
MSTHLEFWLRVISSLFPAKLFKYNINKTYHGYPWYRVSRDISGLGREIQKYFIFVLFGKGQQIHLI